MTTGDRALAQQATVILCPGIHDPELTVDLVRAIFQSETGFALSTRLLIFPAHRYPAYSTPHILSFVHERLSAENPDTFLQMPLVWIGFSAGVVGSITAAWIWQWLGGNVRALIALDGWGVPLGGSFPVHRLSHDWFTHWSSALLGAGEDSFYADPAINHLDLWRSPQIVTGWQIPTDPRQQPQPTTAADFLTTLVHRYS
jgi:hypothetical protein